MKKVLLFLGMSFLLCACSADTMKTEICTNVYEEVDAQVEVTVYHLDGIVPKMKVEMTQTLSEDVAQSISKERILNRVQSSLVSTLQTDAHMEVEYDEKKHTIFVSMVVNTEDMNEIEMEHFNITEEKDVKTTLEKFRLQGFVCEAE